MHSYVQRSDKYLFLPQIHSDQETESVEAHEVVKDFETINALKLEDKNNVLTVIEQMKKMKIRKINTLAVATTILFGLAFFFSPLLPLPLAFVVLFAIFATLVAGASPIVAQVCINNAENKFFKKQSLIRKEIEELKEKIKGFRENVSYICAWNEQHRSVFELQDLSEYRWGNRELVKCFKLSLQKMLFLTKEQKEVEKNLIHLAEQKRTIIKELDCLNEKPMYFSKPVITAIKEKVNSHEQRLEALNAEQERLQEELMKNKTTANWIFAECKNLEARLCEC